MHHGLDSVQDLNALGDLLEQCEVRIFVVPPPKESSPLHFNFHTLVILDASYLQCHVSAAKQSDCWDLFGSGPNG